MRQIAGLAELPLLAWFIKKRFIKFCSVGASGVLVNLSVLYLGQEFLFTAIRSADMRLNVSLGLAIFCATVNNFSWNRAWTWRDRTHHPDKHLLLHFGQYVLAVWVGILLEVVLTNLFVVYLHYLIANAAAIVLASVFNFLVNNFWTFRSHKPLAELALPNIPEPEPDSEPGKGVSANEAK
jgi:dolichol-phosphate mannosyltransferase